MIDNFVYLFLFVGLIATVVLLLSPLFFLYIRKEKLIRQANELKHIRLKQQRAEEIHQELKAQGRI